MERKKTVEGQKQFTKRQNGRLKGLSLYELSISEIQELKGGDQSLDLQQERDLISQIKKNEPSVFDYGLENISKSNHTRRQDHQQNTKKKGERPVISMAKNREHSSGHGLHFNSGIKRKSLSKKKLKVPFNSSISEKCFQIGLTNKQSLEQGQRTKKKIRMVSPRIKKCQALGEVQSLRKHFKKHFISLNLLENPLRKANFSHRNQIQFGKIYHLRQDELKNEMNDLNPHFDLSSLFYESDSRIKTSSLRTSRNSQQMKSSDIRSYARDQHDDYFQVKNDMRNSKRNSIKLSQLQMQDNSFHQLKRTLSAEGNTSLFSTASSKQSPFSRENSFNSQRPAQQQPKIIFPEKVRRDPLYLQLPRQCQYFIPFSRNKL